MDKSLRDLVGENLWLTRHEWDPFDLFLLKKACTRQGLPATWVEQHLDQAPGSVLQPMEQAGLLTFDAEAASFRATSEGERLAAVDTRTVVLLLESPHQDEYLGWGSPPLALGETGRHLSNLLDVLAVTSELSVGVNISDLPVILCNPVSYPTYLQAIGRAPRAAYLDKSEQLRQNFIERLESYDPVVIINACATSPTLQDEAGAGRGANTVTKVVTEHWGQRIIAHPRYLWHTGRFDRQRRPDPAIAGEDTQKYEAVSPSDIVHLLEVI